MAVAEILLGDYAVAVEFLLAADRERTGVDDAGDPEDARRLEAIVHAEDVELEGEARRLLAAEQIGQIDDARRFCRRHLRDDIVELGDIAAHHSDLLAEIAVICGLRINVHADDLLAALGEERNETAPDKAGAADDEDGHARLPWCERCSGKSLARDD